MLCPGASADRAGASLDVADLVPARGGRLRSGGLERPIFHFLALGLVLYLGQLYVWPRGNPTPEPVFVDVETLDVLIRDWTRTTGRTPTDAEIDRLVSDHVDQELLLRAALAQGLHRTDALVGRRLIQNQRFVEDTSGDDRASDSELLERAYALGLERTDVVVRRRLIERMRQIIWAGAAGLGDGANSGAPTTNQPSLRASHVFLSRDRHGASLEAAARQVRKQLTARGLEPGDPETAKLGDPFLHPRDLPPTTSDRLAARFGPGFAEALSPLPERVWSQPIPSSYGLHLVWIHERSPPPRARAGPAAPSETQRRAALQEALQILRRDVDVIRYDRAASP